VLLRVHHETQATGRSAVVREGRRE
jgi:hypothetical protein